MKQHLEAAGFKVVAEESFKSGSPSVLPLLSRIKSENPDILVVMAFPTDDIVIIKQSREIDFSPKLVVLPEIVSKEQFGGTPSDFITGFATWAPESTYPESVSWLAAFRKLYPDRPEPLEYAPMSYMAMKMLLAAVAEVGPDSDAIIHRLERETSDSPFGPVSFSDSKNGHHQVLHQIDILQLQNGKKAIVYPPQLANAKVIYPAPAWKDRTN
jgi:branched-chain amino acid transport system substrate-binding protein